MAKEFPTAPTDSFLVANQSYVARATCSDAVGAFLVQLGHPRDTTAPDSIRVRALVATTTIGRGAARKSELTRWRSPPLRARLAVVIRVVGDVRRRGEGPDRAAS